jgi:hypothetical protein
MKFLYWDNLTPPLEKKNYIKYFFNKYAKNDPDYLREYYAYALKETCYTKDDLEYYYDELLSAEILLQIFRK